ncbi:hypothetical protein [Actinoplanes sp. NPDC026619]|uniref:hypothetical protein n=1 Tax=Actinoplanes sp. NPDC026619 TaxID=3155798 RepID=UPI003409F4F5
MVRMTAGPARVVLLLLVMAVTAACAVAARDEQDETAAGPEWRIGPRSGVGAATQTDPARLTGIHVEKHGEFDRITIGFDGRLPGYRVSYGSASPDVLVIVLRHVDGAKAQTLDVDLPAVGQVRREDPDAEAVRTTVTMSSAGRLPFRIGFSLDSFYVDVAHPGEASGLG